MQSKLLHVNSLIVDVKSKQVTKQDAAKNNSKRQNYVDGYNDYVDNSKQ